MKMMIEPADGRYFIETKLPDTLRSSFGLSRALGLLPFASSNNCSISRGWYIYSIILGAFITAGSAISNVYLLSYTDLLKSNNSYAKSMVVLGATHEGMLLACIFAHVLSIGFHKSDFDFILKSLPGNVGNKSIFAEFWTVAGVLFFIVYVICSAIFYNSEWYHYPILAFACIKEICVYLIIIQFCTLLEIIEIRLKGLIDSLNRKRNLIPLTEAHYSLVIKSTRVNSAYSWQILIICTLIFNGFVSWAFRAIQGMRRLESADDLDQLGLYDILFKITFCTWQLTTLYFIAGSCDGVAEKVEAFNSELFRIMRESKNLCDNDTLNLYVSMKHSVNFTACGFFSLGFPLITSVIAAASTYLVMLVQFSSASA